MNTDRDNFHDWARDKPETSFGAPLRAERYASRQTPAVRWGRLAVFGMLGIALVVGFKLIAGL